MQRNEWLARLDDERVKRIGIEGNFNTEIVMATNPELIPEGWYPRIARPVPPTSTRYG